MFKSTKICDEIIKVLLKIFFRAHLLGHDFVVVCSIYVYQKFVVEQGRPNGILFLEQLLTFYEIPKSLSL